MEEQGDGTSGVCPGASALCLWISLAMSFPLRRTPRSRSTIEPCEAAAPPLIIGGQNHLRIRARPELMPEVEQFVAEFHTLDHRCGKTE